MVSVVGVAEGQNADFRILYELQQKRTPAMDVAMKCVSNSVWLTPAVPCGMAVGGWVGDNRPLLADASIVGLAWGGTMAMTIGLKYIVCRPRPYQEYSGMLVSLTTEPDPSFPSGHTSMAFATATSVSLLYPRWYVVAPSLLWAVSVGFSRLYLGVHYPSDVLVGALIGTGTAMIAYYATQRMREEALMPADALVIPVSISF